MLTEYIAAAMREAKYEILEDDGSYYGEISVFRASMPIMRPWRDVETNCRVCSKAGLSWDYSSMTHSRKWPHNY